jgi:hypothetical protein
MIYLFMILLAADPGSGEIGIFVRNAYEYQDRAACEAARTHLIALYQQPPRTGHAVQALISDCGGAHDRLVYHSYSPAKGEPS